MVNAGARDSFMRGGSDEILRQALIDVLGVDYIEAGYPGANPTDTKLFAAPQKLGLAKLTEEAPVLTESDLVFDG